MQLSWNEDFITGIEIMDDEHKALIDRFHQLYQMMRKGEGHAYLQELLVFLQSYVDTHFEHEEALQTLYDYPEFDAHEELHHVFKYRTTQWIERLSETEASNQDLLKINQMIKEWLVHHIMVEDKKLARFILEQTRGQSDPIVKG